MNCLKSTILIIAASLCISADNVKDAPPPALIAKPYKIGIAPSHIVDPAGPMLTSSAQWSWVASRVNLYKYYGVQLVNTKWATPVDPNDLVALAKREHIELGCEFGGFTTSDKTMQRAIDSALNELDPVFKAGGKVTSLHLDGPIRRQLKGVDKNQEGKDLDDIAAGMVTFFKGVHAKYPEMRIGLITNLPNWDYNKQFPGALGGYTKGSGLTYEQALNTVFRALQGAGEKLAFVEVDCPYNYYNKKQARSTGAALDNPGMLAAIQKWCEQNRADFHLVVNAEPAGGGPKAFHDLTCQYVRQLRGDGIFPDLFIIQSWYKEPKAPIPESHADTFTNTAKDAIELISSLYPSLSTKQGQP